MTTVQTEIRFNQPRSKGYLDDLAASMYKVIQEAEGDTTINKTVSEAEAEIKKKAEEERKKEEDGPTPFDQINGGIREWLNRRACRAPKVNVKEIVQINRQVSAIRKAELNDTIHEGSISAYIKMDEYKAKLRVRAFRPQARINYTNQAENTFDTPYNGKHGTAGLPSNQPNRLNAYRDYSLDTNRGRLLPGILPVVETNDYVDFY